ncbi:hypothetical protein [Yersinia aldovae]|uniref:hypothetical protein n=1 Tax=Yersinia aldovae TaxID=29483 RepID=UPI00069FD028|nr:hypothetical protein [Yersinia aldovae]
MKQYIESIFSYKFTGKNQTGYYVYGTGSSINNQTTGAQNVATEGSTLYRIDGGASFNGGST